MPFPINPTHDLLLESGSYILLESGSKIILDETVALDDPLASAFLLIHNPTFTFAGQNLPGGTSLQYEFQLDTANTFDSQSGQPLLDSFSDLQTGFTDDISGLGDDSLLLEGIGKLLLEDGVTSIGINYSYPSGNYLTYTLPFVLVGGTYFWRVRYTSVSSGVQTVSQWSTVESFSMPVTLGISVVPTNPLYQVTGLKVV
jgi:hypothetical protein